MTGFENTSQIMADNITIPVKFEHSISRKAKQNNLVFNR